MSPEKSQTRSLYGMHEYCPLGVMPDGTVLYIAEIGASPHQGIDLSDEPRTPMVRIQWLFGDDGGCYPPPSLQDRFLQRVESLVRNTPDCHIFVAGNEPNIKTEGLFEPEYAAQMYDAIRRAVHVQPGHEDDLVLLPPIGPWNTEIGYGWIEYFTRLIALCPAIDGFALHSYARGPEPENITAQDKMGAPYEQYYSNFQTYRDWMDAIPERYRSRPAYITEFDENDAWLNQNTRIIQAAYAEIDNWNKTPGNQQIRCLMLYRWPHHDKYFIEDNVNVIIDFMFAQDHGYEWEDAPMAMRTLYQSSFEEGFYFPLGENEQEVTIPVGWDWNYDPTGPRPEYKPKNKDWGQPEVRTGKWAAGFFRQSSIWGGAEFKKFTTTPNAPVRFEVWCMGVHNGGPAAGMSCGIAHSTDFYSDDSLWQEWWSPNMAEYQDRVWKKITATGHADANGEFYVVMFGRTDAAIEGWHTHWDDVKVEVEGDGPVDPPPTGTWIVQVIDPADNVVASCPFEAAANSAEICMHAEAIKALTCSGD